MAFYVEKVWCKMYKVNDVVVYGCSKVCSVRKIGVPDFLKKPQKYYWLQPVGDKTTMLYVKMEHEDKIRSILTEEQAAELFRMLPEMEEMYDKSNKVRDREYDLVMKSRDCAEWLRMWKGIVFEKVRKEQNGKKLNVSDEGNLKRVQDCIASEFSAVFHTTKDEIIDRMKHSLSSALPA